MQCMGVFRMLENEETVREGQVQQPEQENIWDLIRSSFPGENVFQRNAEEEQYRKMIRRHKAWLESFPHECPSPYSHYRIGVYIRYFNQTKYDNYLDYHKQQFADTIALCPNWTLVDFYVDEGQSAPNMDSAKGWTRLLEDCFSGKINLIVTQKTSNVSRKPWEMTFVSRILAAQKPPVGIYFISEDLFTLASYYQRDLKDRSFLPSTDWKLLPDADCDKGWSVPDEEEIY